MCGLLFAIGSFETDSFWKGFKNIKHRGPDASGIFFYDLKLDKSINLHKFDTIKYHESSIALGHHRLKIVDITSSTQPMFFEDLVIAYNGEIYNYKSIRETLKGYGYHFETEGDTEVVLKAFHKWGKGCEEFFNGMWAFVIFDYKSKKLYASRDRFGVKPLYYHNSKDKLVIGSEIKSILPFLKNRRAIKNEVIKFLVYGAQESKEQTLFEGVKRLCPGECLIYDYKAKAIKKERHISEKTENQQRTKCQKQYKSIDQLKKIIIDAVDLRSKNELPFVITLSGGVDSNIITSSAISVGYNFSTISATYGKNFYQSENHLIDKTVSNNRLDHSYVQISDEDILKNLKKIIWYQDEPFDSLGIYAQNLVYKQIRSLGIKVSLDGQGADEVFGGYPTSDSAILKEFSLLKFMRLFMKGCNLIYLNSLKMLILSYFPKFFERIYFYKRMKNIFKRKMNFISSNKKGSFNFKSLKDKSLSDINEHLPILLRYLDRNSMQYSVESREPFLDYRVVYSGVSLRADNLYVDYYRKYPLRLAFKGLVDDEILFNRIKNGFSVPQEKWINSPKLFSALIGHIKNSFILNELEIHNYNEIDKEYQWRICCLAIWESEFEIDGLS